MWTLIALTLSAQAGVTDDVARGWYLWTTGQDDAAHELATGLVADHPDRYDVHRLSVAMEVVQGNGASVEAHYREWLNEQRDDPLRRVSLAFTLAQRHIESGGWCDEVEALLTPLVEGEERYWAALASRQKELRCSGDAGHSDAELRRIAKDAAKASEGGAVDALGWGDGVVARMRAGYVKEDLPKDLQALFDAEPHRIASAGVLWGDNVGGPAKAGARKVANKALGAALEGDDPSLVHAALLAYGEAGKDKQVEEAAARLASLDPEADPELVRSVDDVADPPIYAEIDACLVGYDRASAIGCLEELEGVPDAGAITAYWYSQRRALLDVAKRTDESYEMARSAWQADPDHRFNARMFARRAVSRSEDAGLAADAMAVVVSGREPGDNESQNKSLAADLVVRSRALLMAERGAEALEGQRLAVQLVPSPEQRTVLGLVLVAADRPDDAALQLAHGLAVAFDDTALITSGREALTTASGDWHAEGMPGMLEEVARGLGEPSPRPHRAIGKELPLLELLPPEDEEAEAADEADPDAEPPPPPTTVLALWAPWHEESSLSLERLAGIGELYSERGVQVVAVDVGLDEAELPEDLAVLGARGGAAAMRAMGLVSLPSVVVVDAEAEVIDVIVGWDRSSLALEESLDELLPEEEEEEED